MDEAVDGMLAERNLIFQTFGLGLFGNLCTVLAACWVQMNQPAAVFATVVIVYTCYFIYSSSSRIQKKFHVPEPEAVRLTDLTQRTIGHMETLSTQDAKEFLHRDPYINQYRHMKNDV